MSNKYSKINKSNEIKVGSYVRVINQYTAFHNAIGKVHSFQNDTNLTVNLVIIKPRISSSEIAFAPRELELLLS